MAEGTSDKSKVEEWADKRLQMRERNCIGFMISSAALFLLMGAFFVDAYLMMAMHDHQSYFGFHLESAGELKKVAGAGALAASILFLAVFALWRKSRKT